MSVSPFAPGNRRKGHCFGPLPPVLDTKLGLLIFCCVAAFGVVAHLLVTYVLVPEAPQAASTTQKRSITATAPVRLGTPTP
ncbi:MAG TPA: hypothetical protein PLU72_05785 [Candidatus Ozemobacteraceae bacterium]|nr:hypothetical protein [Candidatus Ozemobacteraceae bacterium]HQG27813.1 hypothetical protein [Candidatus Ozemobacteraceae bacterium]